MLQNENETKTKWSKRNQNEIVGGGAIGQLDVHSLGNETVISGDKKEDSEEIVVYLKK